MIQIILESIGVVVLSAAGVFLGYASSKRRKPYWLIGYILSLGMLLMIGIVATYRYFDSLDELQEAGTTIALTKYSFFEDHYVTVYEVTEQEVIYFDPVKGDETVSREAFNEMWRSAGSVVKKKES